MRPSYKTILHELQLLHNLRAFQPVVIGTPPLGIDVPTSDIDIACCATDLQVFFDYTQKYCSHHDAFSCKHIDVRAQPAVCAAFQFQDWEIEIFCQTIRVQDQWGFRHFAVESRLLKLEPRLREVILKLKKDGLKTEPAFAQALNLSGDPYQAVLDLESRSDSDLAESMRNFAIIV